MNNELLLLIKKDTDTLIEQTRTRPQETLEFKMNKQMQTSSFSPPIILIEEGKWLMTVSSFECTKSGVNITNENNSFSISIPDCRRIPNFLEDNITDELMILLKLKSENDIELHVQEVRKRGNKKKINSKEFSLTDFDRSKKEILGELKSAKYRDLEDLVYRMQLTYDEIIDIMDIKLIPTKKKQDTLYHLEKMKLVILI